MRILRLAIAIAAMMFLTSGLRAQELTHELDSLISTAKELPDTLKAARYNRINWRSRYKWPLIALQSSQQAIYWANQTQNLTELSKGYSFAGLVERNIRNYSEAMRYFKKGQEISLECGDTLQYGHGYNNMGSLYLQMGDTAQALEYLEKALTTAEQLHNNDLTGYVCINYAILYSKQGKYELAEEFFRRCAEARKGNGFSKNSKMSVQYYLIDMFIDEGKLDSAKKYLYNFHKVYVDTMQTWLSDSWRSLSKVYQMEQNYDSALFCAYKALDYGNQMEDLQYILSANTEINKTLLSQGNFKEAADRLFYEVGCQDSIYQREVESHKAYLKFSSDYLSQQAEIDKKNEETRLNSMIQEIVGTVLAVVLIMAITMSYNYIKIKRLNSELANQKKEIDNSIDFAQKIQQAILPNKETFGNVFSGRFLLFKPRDYVSGDFYWKFEDDEYEIIAVADCTGHGVPGASMSMIGSTSLQDIVKNGERDASQILEKLRSRIKTLLHQSMDNTMAIQDGMDIEIIVVRKSDLNLQFSGAYNSLLYIRNDKLTQMKAVRNPIGIYRQELPFKNEELKLQNGDCIYMMSDGFTSQFGGPDDSKMLRSAFYDMLLAIHDKLMPQQCELLDQYFKQWQGDHDQIDDVTIAGFRV